MATAVALHKAGRIDAAQQSYLFLRTLYPKNFDVVHLLGLTFLQMRQFDRSIETLREATVLNPGSAAAHSNLGNAYKAAGKLELALDCYGKALSLNPGSSEARFNRGNARQALNDLEGALSDYDDVTRQQPNHYLAHIAKSNVLIRIHQAELALQAIDEAIAVNPGFVEALSNKGNILTELGRLDEAAAVLDNAIRLNPNHPGAHFNAGNLHLRLRDFGKALASYDKAISFKPDHAGAYCNRGVALKELHRLDEALASQEKAISLAPNDAEAFNNHGNMLKELNRLHEALASYDKAIMLKHDYAEAHSNRGNTLKELDCLDEALASHDEAIRLKPHYAEAHSNRGNTLLELNRLDEALASYDKATSLKPEYAPAHGGRGWAYSGLEDWRSASVNFEAALLCEPGNCSAITGLSLLPPGIVSTERIRELLEIPASGWRDQAQSFFTRANLLALSNDYTEAFAALKRANHLRVADGDLKSRSWREDFERLSSELGSWNPLHPQVSKGGSGPKLLVILGPSRSGKTTLERMLADDRSFFRGFESCQAAQARRSLRSLAVKVREKPEERTHLHPMLMAALFPARAEILKHHDYRVLTITNPYLLFSLPDLADLYQDACFVFVNRDRLDNAAEIFAKDYSNRPYYAYQSHTAIEYVDRYKDVSNQILKILGDRTLEVRFEDIVQRPEKILNDVRGLLALEPSDGVSNSVPDQQLHSPESPYREQFAKLLLI